MLENDGNRQLVEVEQTAMCLFKTVRTRTFVYQVRRPAAAPVLPVTLLRPFARTPALPGPCEAALRSKSREAC